MHFNAHPPMRHHSAYKPSQTAARAFIARYLARARTDAAFRPDADLTQTGVALRTHSADLGLGLKGLVDFEAGLRGKRVYDAETTVANETERVGPWGGQLDGAADEDGWSGTGEDGGDWMDKEQFERMQDEEVGGGEEGKEGTREGEEIQTRQAPAINAAEEPSEEKKKRPLDKEERRALKKAKRKEERRALALQAEQEANG
jgi:hypothetical protein